MADYPFTHSERYAVYVAHGEVCYICREPVDLMSMQVDHVVPEHLADDADELKKVLTSFGLPDDFDLNSYENWMPACAPCNNRKRGRVFKSTPLIQLELQRAAEKASEARELEAEGVSSRKLARALNSLLRANESGTLAEDFRRRMEPLVLAVVSHRDEASRGEPVRLAPLYTVVGEELNYVLLKGPYGVGARPKGDRVDASWNCPTCGVIAAWNGARCVMCGQMDCD